MVGGLAMRRLTVLSCLAGIILTLPLSQSAMAAKKKNKGTPPAKVKICHVTDSAPWPYDTTPRYMAVVGHIISVSENALEAHLAHGDVLVDLDSPLFFLLNDEFRARAESVGLNTKGADCGVLIPIM